MECDYIVNTGKNKNKDKKTTIIVVKEKYNKYHIMNNKTRK